MSKNLKQIPRNPIRFELFNLFALHGFKEKYSIHDKEAIAAFIKNASASIKRSTSNAALLHGLRAEAMFAAMVVSIGAVQMIKHEDSGEVYSAINDLSIPDYRLMLADNTHIFVEVKNFYQGDDIEKVYSITTKYFNGLVKYAEIMGCKLMIAIFWARLGIWVMVPASAFIPRGNKYELSIVDAMYQNEMASIGDQLVGTKPPLRMVFHGEQLSSQVSGDTKSVTMKIIDVQVYCADRIVTDPTELRIALYLMLYGKWNQEGPNYSEDGDHIIMEYICTPEEESDQGFEFIGWLSEMFSRYYLHSTSSEEGTVKSLRTTISPGVLGSLIPDNFKGDALPLWRMTLQPTLPPDRKV